MCNLPTWLNAIVHTRTRLSQWRIGVLAALVLALILYLAGRALFAHKPSPAPQNAHTPTMMQLEQERDRAILDHAHDIKELEQELIKVKADRARLQQLIEQLKYLPLCLMMALACAFWPSPASAQSAPLYTPTYESADAYIRVQNGTLCAPEALGRSMLEAYRDAPRLELQIKALESYKIIAEREISLLEAIRTSTQKRLDDAIARERSWQDIGQVMSLDMQNMERRMSRIHKKRIVWLGVATAVLGGAVVVVAATR